MNESNDPLVLRTHSPAPDFSALQTSSSSTLKRHASPSFQSQVTATSRKRMKEDKAQPDIVQPDKYMTHASEYAEDLAQELRCGCCAELVYRPVLVMPCQHFFCGSCCVLWIRNGGTNCPACRGISSIVTPFRAIQTMVDLLLRIAPHKARTERERQQADEIYKHGNSLRLPTPREASPEPAINHSTEYAFPCPHCINGNPYGWRCPHPIVDPNVDVARAWPHDEGLPPGHAHCGNCENLLALRAPTTTKCDMCQVSFCGIGVQGRCLAAPITLQQPQDMSDISDLIQSADVYDCFDNNAVEVDIMLDYLTTQHLTPRNIYRDIVQHIQAQPGGFLPLIDLDLFVDVHGVAAGPDPEPESVRNRICRLCAAEVLLWGLRDWWVRERQKGYLEEDILRRRDCPEGSTCLQQKDHAHAKEFNHLFAIPISNNPPTENSAGLPAEAPPDNRTSSTDAELVATVPGAGAQQADIHH